MAGFIFPKFLLCDFIVEEQKKQDSQQTYNKKMHLSHRRMLACCTKTPIPTSQEKIISRLQRETLCVIFLYSVYQCSIECMTYKGVCVCVCVRACVRVNKMQHERKSYAHAQLLAIYTWKLCAQIVKMGLCTRYTLDEQLLK